MKIILQSILLIVVAVGFNEISLSQNQMPKADKVKDPTSTSSSSDATKPGIDNGSQNQTNTGLIYFYRLKSSFGSALNPMVLCDNKDVAKMDNGRYFAVSLEQGKHACYIGDKKSGFEIDLKPGESRYAKITIEQGAWKGHGIITLVQPEQATFEIKSLKLLGADKIKDREVVTIYEVTKH